MTEAFELKKGIIEGLKTLESNAFTVRIIPEQALFEDKVLLPRFPVFIQDEQDAYLVGDTVWILTNYDFSVGYILGKIESKYGYTSISLFLDKINQLEEKAGTYKKSDLLQLSVKVNSNLYFEFHNIQTGMSGKIYNSGVQYIFLPDGACHMYSKSTTIIIDKDGNMYTKAPIVKQEFNALDTNIKGKVTEKFSSQTTTVTGNQLNQIAGDQTTVVGGRQSLAITNDSEVIYTKTKKEIVGLGSKQQIVSGNLEISVVAGIMTLKAPIMELPQGFVPVNPLGGGFCAIPNCLFSGVPHQGNKIIGV